MARCHRCHLCPCTPRAEIKGTEALGRALGHLYPAKAIPEAQQACEQEWLRKTMENGDSRNSPAWPPWGGCLCWDPDGRCWGKGRGRGRSRVGLGGPTLSAQQGHGDILRCPLLWFQQFITPVRPPASSATTGTASRSAGRATATPTARTALTRTLPPVVT